MKDVSRIMYTIGKVFSVIEIVLSSLFLVVGILIRSFAEEIYNHQGKEKVFSVGEVRQLGLIFIITSAIAVVICFVVLIIASIAKKKLDNEKKDLLPHIVMIVIGVFGDIFYLLGGVFGIVAETSEVNNQD